MYSHSVQYYVACILVFVMQKSLASTLLQSASDAMYYCQFSEMYFDLLNTTRINTVKQLYRYSEKEREQRRNVSYVCVRYVGRIRREQIVLHIFVLLINESLTGLQLKAV